MTLDAHALLVIHRRAEGWERLVARVLAAGESRVPATALAEAGMVLTAAGGDQLDVLDLHRLVSTLKLTVVPFTEADWTRSVQTYTDRRRTGGPGVARFGECLTAAVAARTGTEVVSDVR
jgi:uncharacterized protein with PIN domain